MIVFITGVLSEKGSRAAEEMLKRGWKVYGADAAETASGTFLEHLRNTPDCYYVQVDYFNERSVQWQVAKVRPDLVMNCCEGIPAKSVEFLEKAAKAVGAKLV